MNEKKYFCTLFDKSYLIKGLAMIASLMSNCPEGHIYVLCMDEYVLKYFEKFPSACVTTISLSDFETKDLLELKKTRSVAEYCWTLSPCLPWYILEKYNSIDLITYLDADLFFYSSIKSIFQEINQASIAIIEHRFSEELLDRIVNGKFCVEWVSFRRDPEGLKCLARWRNQCIEWCFYRLENGKMGDQKYLDEWPDLYSRCHVIENIGAGVAPWNYGNYEISEKSGSITVDGQPLIFYHFHQFQILEKGKFERISKFYSEKWPVPEIIYSKYEVTLLRISRQIELYDSKFFYRENYIGKFFSSMRKKWQT